jgi:hypothetical protein
VWLVAIASSLLQAAAAVKPASSDLLTEHMSGRGKLICVSTNTKCAAADELVAGAAEAPWQLALYPLCLHHLHPSTLKFLNMQQGQACPAKAALRAVERMTKPDSIA